MKTPFAGLLLLTAANTFAATTVDVAPAPNAWQPAQTMGNAPAANAAQNNPVPVQSTPGPAPNAPLPPAGNTIFMLQ